MSTADAIEQHGKTRQWVADRCGVSTRTIDDMVRTRTIPHLRFGRRVVFFEDQLAKWEADQFAANSGGVAPPPSTFRLPAPRRGPRRAS
jgi:excisionase family DNA binding protein